MVQSHLSNLDDKELLQLLPQNNTCGINKRVSDCVISDSELLTLLKLAHGNLDTYQNNYQNCGYTELLLPQQELVFNGDETSCLCDLYQQLNPNCNIEYVSPFYKCAGRVTIGGDILGSTTNN